MAGLFVDENTEYLEVDSVPAGWTVAIPMTFSCWFLNDEAGLAAGPMGLFDLSLGAIRIYLSYRADDVLRWTISSPVGASSPETANTWSDNVWNHALGKSVTTTDHQVILNGDTGNKGTAIDSVTGTWEGLDRISIGRLGDASPSFYVSGKIAEVAMWDVALSDAEAVILSLGYSPLLVKPESLVFYAPLVGIPSAAALNDRIGGLALANFNTVTAADHPRVFNPAPQALGLAAAAAGAPAALLPLPVNINQAVNRAAVI